MHMNALQDRCVASEGVIQRFHKCQEIENKEQAQYSEVVCTLNQELTTKTKALAKKTHRLEEAKKAKTNLATEVASLREQKERARVDAVAEFCISQPFFDPCGIYYGEGFEDCLKQVRAAHPNLNLSQITIDTIVPPTFEGEDTVSDETVDSIHTIKEEVETNDVVIAQPAPGGPDGLPTENPTTTNGLPIVNPPVPDAPLS